ncbi:unnamed protein product (macronuclear) [Paramecium tetraurelia]|uniref:Uncharacterized protein n=1 Tax=Paramecium tetraurelia TaxID=5888 RepID=A0BQI1_PARTE|nr:uncharacterized protein GSPATT00031027001 [Paramecium tetraurelia]CAK60798.1 unnamed protein product [Paramecium tetraurelia]|eukprot:XP_001428196.1 hypothetical protein (macronuclear) [Paramecium tetraurelia strain d4-2]
MSSVGDDSDSYENKKPSSYGSVILIVLTLAGIAGFTAYAIMSSEDSNSTLLETVFNQNAVLDTYWNQKFNNTLAKRVRVKVRMDSDNELTVKIGDADEPGFELPEDSEYFPRDSNSKDTKDGKRSYRVDLKQNGSFTIYRVKDGEDIDTIFDSVGHQLIVAQDYTQFATTLNSKYLYGMGQRRKELRYKGTGNYTTWPKDQFGTNDYGSPGNQLYGYHPMWLTYEKSGNYHVGFLKSTSALLTQIDEAQRMVFHVVGGNIVLKFFLGQQEPEKVIKSYHRYINGFGLHPFWAQGYHQCRWGYKSTTQMLDVLQNMATIEHPVESMWNDLDYMTNYQVFTLDTEKFKKEDMKKLVDRSTPQGIHWVPLVDIGIATKTKAEEIGNEFDIFLKSSVYSKESKPSNLEGCVWPGAVVFPDFNNPKSQDYWTNCSELMRDQGMEPSGWWIDMNEMASFIPGERDTSAAVDEACYGANPPSPPPVKKEIDDRLWFPVLVTGFQPLAHKTVSLNAVHYGKEDGVLLKTPVKEQYFHSLNNLGEQIATHKTLQKFTNKTLTFSLTRGSIYGSGRYTALWTGDNLADWEFLRLGVSELLSFQFYGIPLVGNDLCGFAGNTNPELCARWLALGAWEPFARNHNDNESISQEPYSFAEAYVKDASVAAFKNRYSLLKWMYSLFVNSFEPDLGAGTGTIIQPIWWNNPDDEFAYQFEDSEFLFGNTFLVAPVLSRSSDFASQKTTIKVYFPKGSWINCDDFKTIYTYKEKTSLEFTRAFNQQALSFQKEGTLVFRQDPKQRARLLDSKYSIYAFLNSEGMAVGQIMTLSNFDENDDNNVAAKCWTKGSNCIAVYTIKALEDNKFSISIKGQEASTIFEPIIIQKVIINNKGEKLEFTINEEVTKAGEFIIPLTSNLRVQQQ